MERVVKKKNYKNAFNCKKCPGTDDETGCPNWWRWEEKNDKGEARIVEECGFSAGKYFEVQRLNNTRFVVDNVVATKNSIAETGQKLLQFLTANPGFIEALTDDRPASTFNGIASPAGHDSQRLADGGASRASADGSDPPCAQAEFSNY